jgi:hypothetical protein
MKAAIASAARNSAVTRDVKRPDRYRNAIVPHIYVDRASDAIAFYINGLLYLTEMKVAFPVGGTSEDLSNVELLRKLDRTCLGFTEWANSLQSASVQPRK